MRIRRKLLKLFLLLLLFSGINGGLFAQNTETTVRVSGTVFDEDGLSVIGAVVSAKGTGLGTTTDIDGKFSLMVPEAVKALHITYMGMEPQDVNIEKNKELTITMYVQQETLEEVVVVGYGVQKKNSLVGAIVQTTGEDLKRTGVSTNLANALTGQLAGVTTIQTTGMPGDDDPTILIRAKSTWNNSNPLILVDGIERKMSDIDVNEVETISVLKDGSATAVYGVRGAEGVILITTKRGREGKPEFNFSSDFGLKIPSTMPGKMNSYDSYKYRNYGIERELVANENSWVYYMPENVLDKYKNRQSPDDFYFYPDVDWADEMLRDFALTQRYNLNVRGGSKFAKYFGSLAYTQDGDIFETGMDIGLPYTTDFSYKRYNYRTNLDLNLTPTTVFSINLAGYLGLRTSSNAQNPSELWRGLYHLPPGVFPVQYQDGIWGYSNLDPTIVNPIATLNSGGVREDNRTQMNTDFILQQKLDFITPGLEFRGSFSYDSQMFSMSTVNPSQLLKKYVDPITGEVFYRPNTGDNEYDYVLSPEYFNAENVSLSQTFRKIFYQFQFNYNRRFGAHTIGATAVMNREERTTGSAYSLRREDWVGRITYDYNNKYLLEANGAYTGSDQFGPGHRFDFFPSLAVGWMVSNEKFLSYEWLNKLKLRYSIGKTGNDNFRTAAEQLAQPFPYITQWGIDKSLTNSANNDYTFFGVNRSPSPYLQYKEMGVGNPDLLWETVQKQNFGLELSVLNGMFSANFDYFTDKRDNVFLRADQRTVMDYFGAQPVAGNIGKVEAHGYEIELRYQNKTNFGMDYWFGLNYTYAKDKVLFYESGPLLPDYRKEEGFQIGQSKTQIGNGYLTSWDDVYASVPARENDNWRLPGDLAILDFNGDGEINEQDVVPYGFPNRPQDTYSLSAGIDYKDFSFMIQFYGVFNTTILYPFPMVTDKSTNPLVYDHVGNYWSLENPDPDWKAPRASTTSPEGHLAYFDGSFLRLKNIELAYDVPVKYLQSIGVESLKLSVGANNLFFWSKLPEDRETTLDSWGDNLYPNLKRINMGVNVSF